MCFYFQNLIKIAKKNIPCWKIISKNNKSIYFVHDWKKGEKTPIKHLKIKCNNFIYNDPYIEKGYHSYKTLYQAKTHWWNKKENKIIKLYISKGSLYAENDIEYVSNCLLWK